MSSVLPPPLRRDLSVAEGRPDGQDECRFQRQESTRPPLIEGRAQSPTSFEFVAQLHKPDLMGSPKVEQTPQNAPDPDGGGAQSQSPTAPGSTSSRGFEPEGSIDMSPLSEAPSTPAFVRWRENIHLLLNDTDGAQLFLQYLTQQRLEHLLNFWALCNGMKVAEQAEKVPKIANYAFRKFIAPSKSSNLPFKLDCIDETIRQSIGAKLDTKSVDANIFDGAQEQVVEHMAATSYLKFFESDIYLNYIQSLDNPDLSDVNSSKFSETQSSSSSVSGKAGIQTLDPAPPKARSSASQSHQPTTGAKSKAKIDIVGYPDANSSLAAALVSPPTTKEQSMGDASSSGPRVTSSSTSHLPTVDEDSELTISKTKGRSQSSLTISSLHSTQHQRLNSLHRRFESHPDPVMRPHAPYHAHSSTWNPVSQNDSEIQSQSSGALGDTTDDGNYSSFTDLSSSQFSNTLSHGRRDRSSRHSRHVQDKQMRMHAEQNREDPLRHLAQRPNRQGMAPPLAVQHQDFHKQVCQKLNQMIAETESKKKLAQKLDQLDEPLASGNGKPSSRNIYKNDESDQSILDDHLSRVFENTPSRSPPNERRQPNVSMNMSTNLDASQRAMMASGGFHGHNTWSGRRSGREPQASGASSYSYGRPNESLHPSYRAGGGGGSSGYAGDSAYYSREPHKPVNKSFSDFDFGTMRGGGAGSAGGRGQPPTRYPGYHPQDGTHSTNERVSDWIASVNNSSSLSSGSMWGPEADQRSHRTSSVVRGTVKTSPRSSGRSSSKLRAKSSDRMNQSQPVAPSYNNLASYQPMSTNKLISNASKILQKQSGQSGDCVQMIYTFPHNKDDLPYMTRTDSRTITLKDVKDMCPKKGQFRYFFKTAIDDMTVYQEEYEDHSQVPLLGGKVVVQCRGMEC